MEPAATSIKSLAEHVLPKQPYYLSLSPTRRYRVHPDEKRLDEQDIRPLQYTTLVGGEADRGVLITRAYFSVREEPSASCNAPTPTTLKVDPNKPRKKVSLKDYKNKKVEGDSPQKIEEKEKEKPNGLSTIKEKEEPKKPAESVPKEMESRRDVKNVRANLKVEATRRRSPSPERRKRVAEVDEGSKPIKRAKVEDAVSNGTAPRPSKEVNSQKPMRSISSGKTEAKDTKISPAGNGRPASSNSAVRAGSPRYNSQVNGHGKTSSGQLLHKRAISNGEPVSRAVPRLLSPLYIADLSMDKSSDTIKESTSESRPSPKKKPMESSSLKPQPKRLREDREPSPSAKKRKVLPPLLSPTLPPIVMNELARIEKKSGTPSKEATLKNSQTSDSSVIVKKPAKSTREDTIHVDNKREEPAQYIVTMKYKKRHAKTIERLLNLPSGGKKKAEGLKREDQPPRESSGSVEPGTARKRPRTTTETSEALKRPKIPDILRPSTPPKQSTAMTRITSNSSQVGTPGATNGLTPSTHLSADKRRELIPPEKLSRAQRLHALHKFYMQLGTKLKHQRDAAMKTPGIQDREHQNAVAVGLQSILSYMHAVKFQSDAFDLDKIPRRLTSWKEVLELFRIARMDCSKNAQLFALLLRIQAICFNFAVRSLWTLPNGADAAGVLLSYVKEEAETWRSADQARRKLGAYDGGPNSSDGGAVGKLIDRLGPWSTPEDAIPISLEVMRNVFYIDWKPNDDLVKVGRPVVNGATG
ncbi:hypothetical protein FHL15_008685 [Xylaria flabelliformis]|uniref:Uncharacterized protein n=1 Tax=Xylaria flabelliformis TaxID=2512241 RepID=A0A553HRD0_9PEZI|nr:hypothetical protein FHL15_008685 [Xylaria flabelliformis]